MSFFQEKIFLTKKNIFRPGANALIFFTIKFREVEEYKRVTASPDASTGDVYLGFLPAIFHQKKKINPTKHNTH